MTFPCKECIVFVMCRNRLRPLTWYMSYSDFAMALIDQCEMLQVYTKKTDYIDLDEIVNFFIVTDESNENE